MTEADLLDSSREFVAVFVSVRLRRHLAGLQTGQDGGWKRPETGGSRGFNPRS